MQEYMEGISSFGYTSVGAAWLHDEMMCCWPAQDSEKRRGLLWRIYLPREALEQAWQLPGGGCPPPEQAQALVQSRMEEEKQWTRDHPDVLLPLLELRVQPYLLDPELLELHLLTGYARPLERAFPAGLRDEAAVLHLGQELCAVCRTAEGAGLLAKYLCPGSVFQDERGRVLLGPFWPGADGQRPEGFFIEAEAGRARAYSAAMLLFWLLNGGGAPFAEDAARRQDAEDRRLAGEPLPTIPGVSPGLSQLLGRLCHLPAGPDCSMEALERGLRDLVRPEPEAGEEEAGEKLRQEEETRERQREEAEQLRRHQEKERRRDEKGLGSDAGDRRMLGLLIVGIGIVVAAVCLFFGLRAMNRLQSSMASGNFATALEQIEQSYASGENVDELVEAYVDECLENQDYIRAMAAYSYWSTEQAPRQEQVEAVVEMTLQAGEPRRAQKFLTAFSEKGTEYARIAREIYEQFSEELLS